MPSAGIAAVLIGITVATVLYLFFSSEEEETISSQFERGYRDGGVIPSYPNTDRRRAGNSSHFYEQEYTRLTSGICSICLESLSVDSQVVLNTCKHTFHTTCINEWIIKANQASCPNCRRNIR